MTRIRSSAPLTLTAILALSVVAWSVWIPVGLDALWPFAPPLSGSSNGWVAYVWGQIIQPVTAYLAMIVLVVVLAKRRWRDMAGSLLLAMVLTVSIVTVLKSLIARARPQTPWLGDLHVNASYPSGHAAAGAALAIAVVQVTWTLTQRRRPTVIAAVAAGIGAVTIALARVVLEVHHVSDVLGGALVAAFAAALASVLTGAWRAGAPEVGPRRVHVVWHPNRVKGQVGLERRLARMALARGCQEPQWTATESDEHTVELAHTAVEAGADVVVVLGGDGTIRRVLGAVGREAAVAVVPAGSGNLLAKNTGIPLDATRAFRLALDGAGTPLDLLRVAAEGHGEQLAAVMVGAGADAAVLEDTSERGKRRGGALAYLRAGLRHVAANPTGTSVIVDGEQSTYRASLVTVGNVGSLHPGAALLPDADPSDGILDVLVASPTGTRDVLAMIVGVLLGRPRIRHVTRLRGLEVQVAFDEELPLHIDGDVVGHVGSLAVSVSPGAALLVRP